MYYGNILKDWTVIVKGINATKMTNVPVQRRIFVSHRSTVKLQKTKLAVPFLDQP